MVAITRLRMEIFFAEQIRSDPFLSNQLEIIQEEIYDGKTAGELRKSFGEVRNLPIAAKEFFEIMLGLAQPDADWNLEVGMVGSYRIDWKADNVGIGGAADVRVEITNSTSPQSLTRPPFVGYTEAWNKFREHVPGLRDLDENLPSQKQTVILNFRVPGRVILAPGPLW